MKECEARIVGGLRVRDRETMPWVGRRGESWGGRWKRLTLAVSGVGRELLSP